MSLNFNKKTNITLSTLYQEAISDIIFDNICLFNDRSLKKISPKKMLKLMRLIDKTIIDKDCSIKSEYVQIKYNVVDDFLQKYSH